MFPIIPENLAALTGVELRSLAAEIRTAVSAVNDNPEATVEDYELALGAQAIRKSILSLATTKDALAATEMSEAEEAEPVVEEAVAEPVVEDLAEEAEAETEEVEAPSTEAAEEIEDGTSAAEDENTELQEAQVKPKVRTSTGATVALQEETESGRFTPDKLLARGGVSGMAPGAGFSSWGELAETLVDIGKNITPSSNQKFEVAFVPGNFDSAHTLSESFTQNLRKFEPEVMAEMCAPAEPQYDLDCWNTDRRPVRGSLAAYKPDARGAVTIYPSPSLSDVTGQSPLGVGIWDNDDDISLQGTDPSSKGCAVISCAEPTLYRLYGVWRCLTVQNLLAMTFPELVEAYLNRLAASHARLAETQLLEAMGTAAVPVTQSDLGYGSSVSITSSVMNMLALHQEQERWDLGEMDAWLPRWVRTAMKMDIVRRRNTSGDAITVPADSVIDRMFMDAGVSPHFFIDTPSWATAVPAVQTAGVLNLLPSSVEMVIAPRGKFAVMDRGELSIGVTGNNLYRDNSSNASNQFTFFFENFEGLVDTNSCPAYLLTIEDLCHNGIQIADEVLNCDGGNTIS
jgi:hypothetical protein